MTGTRLPEGQTGHIHPTWESALIPATDLPRPNLRRRDEEYYRAVGYDGTMRTRPENSLWATLDRRPALTDAVIAVVLATLATVWLWLQWPPDRLPATPLTAGLGLLQGLPLAWRRRRPLTVLPIVTVGTILYGLAGGADTIWTVNAWLLAAYTAGAYGAGRWRDPVRLVATITFIGYVAWEVFSLLPAEESEPLTTGNMVLLQLFTFGGNIAIAIWIWWFGDGTRIRHQREAELAERTAQLERQREANTRQAVSDERLRIAREVHDVVAHHVSLMGIQAGAARRVFRRQPETAEDVLTLVEASSREAVRELHRLVGFLRHEQDADTLDPLPDLSQLPELIRGLDEVGLPVDLTVTGEIRPLPPAIDLCGYRIIQEALTNTLRHAGPATATVVVHYGPDSLDIDVRDDGRGAGVGGNGQSVGNGLTGMRERVNLLSGHLRIGPEVDGGYRVLACLPLGGPT